MANAWRGENRTATEKAAALLAWHFGYGSGFGQMPEPQDFAAAVPWRPVVEDGPRSYAGNENRPGASPGIHFGRASETLELAHNAIHRDPKKWPKWVCELPDAQRVELLAWSEAHPFERGMPDRVREFRHWQTNPGTVFLPRSAYNADAAAALANVPRQLRAILELAALERAECAPTVVAALRGCGFSAAVAHEAIVRWLYPVKRTGSLADAAKAAGIRKADFGRLVRDAVGRLRGWQYRASIAFLDAFGSHVADAPTVAPKLRKPLRLSKPRFWRGCWDTTQRPGTLIVVIGNQLHPQEGVTSRDESRRHVNDAPRRRAA